MYWSLLSAWIWDLLIKRVDRANFGGERIWRLPCREVEVVMRTYCGTCPPTGLRIVSNKVVGRLGYLVFRAARLRTRLLYLD